MRYDNNMWDWYDYIEEAGLDVHLNLDAGHLLYRYSYPIQDKTLYIPFKLGNKIFTFYES